MPAPELHTEFSLRRPPSANPAHPAQLLLDNRADVNAKSDAGLTPITGAASGGHIEVRRRCGLLAKHSHCETHSTRARIRCYLHRLLVRGIHANPYGLAQIDLGARTLLERSPCLLPPCLAKYWALLMQPSLPASAQPECEERCIASTKPPSARSALMPLR